MSEGKGGLGRTVTNSALWVVLEQWSTKFVSLAMFALMARLLAPEDFGLLALATAFIAVLKSFVDSGFSKALIQKKELGEKDAATAFWTSLAISVVLYGLLVLTAPMIASAMDVPELELVLIVLGATLPISALSRIPAALLSREFAFKSLSVRAIAGTLAGSVVALPMALLGAGVWALVAQTIVETLTAVIVLWTATSWRPGFSYSFTALRSLGKTGISLLGIDLLDTVQAQIDKFIVGALFSTTELGVYSLAQRLGVALQEVITTVIARLSLPTFSRVQEDLPRVHRIFRQLTFTTATVSFPVFALVAVLSTQLIPFVFGPGWEEAIPLVWIMAGGWAFASVAMFDRGALVGTGHAGAAFSLALIQNAISILLVFLFAPFGLTGIAFSRFGRLVTWPIRLFALNRYVKLPVWRYVWQVLRCVLAVAPVVVAIALLQMTPWAQMEHSFWLFAIPVGAVGFLAIFGLNWLFADRESTRPLREQFSRLRRKKS
jgi:O-antigen/teichoic acid export membrane protein